MMTDKELQSKLAAIVGSASSTENEKTIAAALLSILNANQYNFSVLQWAHNQIKTLATQTKTAIEPVA